MAWVIDRFEEGFGVLENTETQEILNIPKAELPKGSREGAVLKKVGDHFEKDPEGTAARKKLIQEKFSRLKFK